MNRWMIGLATTMVSVAIVECHGASFTIVGDLEYDSVSSCARGVSADGSTIVGDTGGWDIEAFRWTESAGLTGLDDLATGRVYSRGEDVSADGSIVVGSARSPDGYEAFRWTESTGMVSLGDLDGGAVFSTALGISSDGSTIVGRGQSALGEEAFRWTEATGIVGLGDLLGGGFESMAWAASADGSVIVGESDTPATYAHPKAGSTDSVATGIPSAAFPRSEAFRWTESGGMVGLGDLLGGMYFSKAHGVSADGSVVVGRSSSGHGFEAFRWTEADGMVGLGDLEGGDFNSIANDVSADGSIVVGQGRTDDSLQAFIWTQSNGMRSLQDVLTTDYGLDLTGWTLWTAHGISDDGRFIVGEGTDPNGIRDAWIAEIPHAVPEPSTLAMLCGLAVMGVLFVTGRLLGR